ncbi:hypothetical protein ACTXT7_003868 [Hymenolepis weldensis]
MANFTRDSALIDSEATPTHVTQNVCINASIHTICGTAESFCRTVIFTLSMLPRSISVNCAERLDIKKAVVTAESSINNLTKTNQGQN